MGKSNRSLIAIILLFSVLVSVIAADIIRSRDPYVTAADEAMGSVIIAKAYGFGKGKVLENVIEQIKKEDAEYWSRYASASAVSKLNNAEYSITVERRVVDMLTQIAGICKAADGEIDLTIGTLTELWGFDADSPSVPDAQDLALALDSVSYNNLAIDGTNVFLKNNASLDLGAFGKGIACDIAKKIVDDSSIKGATVSVGGSVLVYGKQREKDTWSVGLRNPDGTANEYFAVLELNDCIISTSGTYEKGFTSNGIYYHHILSSKTGMPVKSEFKSVSVVSGSGLVSDALSTACFILGYEKSLPLLEEYESEAVFVDEENNVTVTSGLKSKITVTNPAFKLNEGL